VKIVEARTKTPNVPYGESFEVVSRYCITFESEKSTRFFVSSKVEFSKKLMWEKSIESAAIDGCTSFSKDLAAQVAKRVAQDPLFGLHRPTLENIPENLEIIPPPVPPKPVDMPLSMNNLAVKTEESSWISLMHSSVANMRPMNIALFASALIFFVTWILVNVQSARVYSKIDLIANMMGTDRKTVEHVLSSKGELTMNDAMEWQYDQMEQLIFQFQRQIQRFDEWNR
jgi:hypothetical protein